MMIICTSCHQKKSKTASVEVRSDRDGYKLYRNNKLYTIKGAAGPVNLDKIAEYGGNSVRTWNTQNADQILDEAHQLDLTVILGLEVGKEWWGDDFDYWDFKAVDKKIAGLRKIVERYKDHPALLIWGVGNEVHLFGGNHVMVLYTINKIAKMIHEVDPNHPVMTTVPLGENFDKRGVMRILCPEIDILGVNGFYDIPKLYDEVRSVLGWNKAYILTELGAAGPWEMRTTNWGAPIEPNSAQKADLIKHFLQIVQKDNYCLGTYAFYWGHKYERTHTFMSLFFQEKYETESVNAFRAAWSSTSSDNHYPKIDSIKIQDKVIQDNQYLIADTLYQATIYAYDPDQDSLTYQWELRPEGRGLFEVGDFNQNLQDLFSKSNGPSVQFTAPAQEGGYRLYGFVKDGHKQIATHNIPFYVTLR